MDKQSVSLLSIFILTVGFSEAVLTTVLGNAMLLCSTQSVAAMATQSLTILSVGSMIQWKCENIPNVLILLDFVFLNSVAIWIYDINHPMLIANYILFITIRGVMTIGLAGSAPQYESFVCGRTAFVLMLMGEPSASLDGLAPIRQWDTVATTLIRCVVLLSSAMYQFSFFVCFDAEKTQSSASNICVAFLGSCVLHAGSAVLLIGPLSPMLLCIALVDAIHGRFVMRHVATLQTARHIRESANVGGTFSWCAVLLSPLGLLLLSLVFDTQSP